MKRLLFSFAIMLFASAAATTAWGEASEQETKDFIVTTVNKCDDPDLKEFQFKGANLHISLLPENENYVGWSFTIPIDKLNSAGVGYTDKSVLVSCAGSEGKCIKGGYHNEGSAPFHASAWATGDCPEETARVLEKAFNHLIGIYKAQRPKPLFE